jgi:hypothetical protein
MTMHPLPRLTLGSALLLALLTSSQVLAQAAAGGISLDTYRFSTPEAVGLESVSLLVLPLSAEVPLGPVQLGISGAFARGELTRADGTRAEMSGLTDTELRVALPLLGQRLAVMGILMLPTGSSTHSAAEAEVGSLVAADLLPFRIAYWGAGGGAGLGTSYRVQNGATGLQVGLSYMVAREFEPLQEARFGYRPGNQLSASVGVEHRVGPSQKLGLQVILQHFGDDAVDGENLYRPGSRVHLVGSYAMTVGGSGSALVYAGGMHRGAGDALQSLAQDAPVQRLLLAGGGLRLPLAQQITLLPSVDVRSFRSEDGIGQGHLSSAGAAAEIPVGSVVVVPSLRARFGSVLVRQGRESGIMGFDLGLTLRFAAEPR